MRRLLAILGLVLPIVLTMPPARAAPARQEVPEEDLPIPPIPPDDPPQDTDAPVPNVDVYGPAPPEHQGAELKPVLDSRPPPLPGGDPVPGTVYRSDIEQRHALIPSPGLRLVVPLDK